MENQEHPSFKRRLIAAKPPQLSWEAYQEKNRAYYRDIEIYDWTATADRLYLPESWLHKYREWWLVRLLRPYLKSSPRALDIGCGTGLILRHLPPGSIGLDINPRNLERLPKYAPKAVGRWCDLEQGVPYPDSSFDLVVAAEVLEHLIYPEQVVSEVYRVLGPDGVFVGSVPLDSPFWRFRFLSLTYHSTTKHYESLEPFHNELRVGELRELLATKFGRIKLYPALTNIFFVAHK